MIEFFNAKMQEAKLNTAPGNPVIAAQINLEQNFAFIEVHCVVVVCLSVCLFYMYACTFMYSVVYACSAVSIIDSFSSSYDILSFVQLKRLLKLWLSMESSWRYS